MRRNATASALTVFRNIWSVPCGIAFAFGTSVMKMVIISIALSALVLWALA